EGPQQHLINNLGEALREQHALEGCSQQQQEALQRFLNMGISYNAAALMAHSQYPCDSTDQLMRRKSFGNSCAKGPFDLLKLPSHFVNVDPSIASALDILSLLCEEQ